MGEVHEAGTVKGVDFAAEIYRQHLDLTIDDAAMAWLDDHGITPAARLRAGNVGIAEIETTRDGLYQPAPSGRRAFIQPVYTSKPVDVPILHPNDPVPLDLIAWLPDQPTHWWLRRGVGVFLGEYAVSIAADLGEPLQICRSPLAWLRAGGAGTVVIGDWVEARFRLHGLKLLAEDPSHGWELQRGFRLAVPDLPEIYVPRCRAA